MTRKIDQYTLFEEIGTGGMATVYRALDTQLERPSAIKVLHDHIARDPEHRKRFIREARAVARFRHPNIVQIYGFADEASDSSYIAMELIDGPTLREFVDEHVPEDVVPEVGAMIMCIAATALHAAHEQGVLHRDIKPENIMIDCNGSVKLMDFGLARLLDAHSVTATGSLLGSPAHMAPEIIEGESYDRRVDIFSLGTVLYFACTGELPFRGSNPAIVLRKVLAADFELASLYNAEILPSIDSLISRSLHLDPSERPQTAQSFANELKAALFEVGITDVESSFAEFWASPVGWVAEFRERLPAILLAEAEVAKTRGGAGYPHAIALCNRVLTLDAENAHAQRLIDSLGADSVGSVVKRPRLVIAAILALVLTVAAGLFVFERHRASTQREGVDSSMNYAGAALGESLFRSRVELAKTSAHGVVAIALERGMVDTGILRAARSLDARYAAAIRVRDAAAAGLTAADARASIEASRGPNAGSRPDTTATQDGESEREAAARETPGRMEELPTFDVTFVISPPVANLYVDGELLCSATPRCTRALHVGSHVVIARHPDTRMQTRRQIEVANSGAQYRLRVPWPPAGLYIESNVPGTVLLDGDRVGRTGQMIRISIDGIGRVRRGTLRIIPDGSFDEPIERGIALVAGETSRDSVRFRSDAN